MAILDTTALIDAEHEDPAALQLLQRFRTSGEVLRVTAASWMEYLSSLPEGQRTDAIGRLLGSVTFEAMTRELAGSCAALQHALYSRGLRLGWHDVHIAATALHYHEPLVTRDRGFERVPGLLVQAY